MIPSPNRSWRGSRPVRLIVVHTAEGARTRAALGGYFARASSQASSHVGIDSDGVEQYVPYSEAAWTLRAGNAISDNAELCAFAAMTREQWLSPSTVCFRHPQLRRDVYVDEPYRLLERTAGWIAERCTARDIPLRKLTPAEVAAGKAGVIGHVDWTLGMRDGSHTDPGEGFPWDVVLELARQASHTGALTGTSPVTSTPPKGAEVLDNIPVTGQGTVRRIIPIGRMSDVLARGWVSVVADGPAGAKVRVFAQDDRGGLADLQLEVGFRDGWSERKWWELPDGTTQVNFLFDAPDGGVIALEAKPKP